jgi:hypothetical protein
MTYVGFTLPIDSDDKRGVNVRYDKDGVVMVSPQLSTLNVTAAFPVSVWD